jgi:hypothetical protein
MIESRRLLSGTVLVANALPDESLQVGSEAYQVTRPQRSIAPASLQQQDATTSGAAGFQIELQFTGGLTSSQQAIFTAAAARWQQILTGDIPDVAADFSRWGAAVDDVRISASGTPIDGVGGILGQAGPDWIRGGSSLPINGVMEFDSADLADLQSSGQLNDVITHEMGHVLGFGTIWDLKGLLSGAGTANSAFTGAAARTQSNAARKTSATSVPVENSGGAGTADAHWRETTFDNELMTGYLNFGANPLSRITAAQFADLGYPSVNVDGADPYVPPSGNTLPTIGTLSDSPDPINAGSTLTLSVSSATDSDGVANVSFYCEANGMAGLQTALGDVLVGSDTTSPYSLSTSTAGLSGSYTYYARVTDNFGAVSSVATTTNTVQAGSAPLAPSAPDLASASDSGLSSTDNITKFNTPTFTGAAAPNAAITVFSDGVSVGTGTADASGNWSITTSALVDGAHSITATAANAFGTSPASAGLDVTIDTSAPTLSDATSFEYLTAPQEVVYHFSENVGPSFAAGDVAVTNTTTATTLTAAQMAASYGGSNAGVLTFPGFTGGVLPDGNYTATLNASQVSDIAGNTLAGGNNTLNFFVLTADANHDKTVDTLDFNALAANFGLSGQDYAHADFNYDGTVDTLDFNALASKFGTTLAPAAVPAATQSTRPGLFSDTAVDKDVLDPLPA